MVSVDSAHTASLKSHGHTFEILIDSDKAIAFKSGQGTDIKDVLAVEKVFSDAKKGMEASPNALKQAFGTDDVLDVSTEIIRKGEFSLTTEYKAKLREDKLKQIVDRIHRNAVDQKTHVPHPPERIKSAIE